MTGINTNTITEKTTDAGIDIINDLIVDHLYATELSLLTKDLEYYLKLNGNANDSAFPNVITPTATSMSYVSGILGRQCGDFDGSLSKISLGNINYISDGVDGEYTIALWIKFDTVTVQQFFFGDETTGNNGVMLQLNTSGQIQTYRSTIYYTSTTVLKANVWYHIVLTADGSNCDLYINGELDTDNLSASHLEASDNTYIGVFGNASRYTNGRIQDVRIYSTEKTASEINIIYHSGRNSGGIRKNQLCFYEDFSSYTSGNYIHGGLYHGTKSSIVASNTYSLVGGISAKLMSYDNIECVIPFGTANFCDWGIAATFYLYYPTSPTASNYIYFSLWGYHYDVSASNTIPNEELIGFRITSADLVEYFAGSGTWTTTTRSLSSGTWHEIRIYFRKQSYDVGAVADRKYQYVVYLNGNRFPTTSPNWQDGQSDIAATEPDAFKIAGLFYKHSHTSAQYIYIDVLKMKTFDIESTV